MLAGDHVYLATTDVQHGVDRAGQHSLATLVGLSVVLVPLTSQTREVEELLLGE